MHFQVNNDNELVLITQDGPSLTVHSYDKEHAWFSIEILDVMFEVQVAEGAITAVRVPDDSEYNIAAALISEDYQDLIYAACMKFRELVVEG